jgi:hypothetical protein
VSSPGKCFERPMQTTADLRLTDYTNRLVIEIPSTMSHRSLFPMSRSRTLGKFILLFGSVMFDIQHLVENVYRVAGIHFIIIMITWVFMIQIKMFAPAPH